MTGRRLRAAAASPVVLAGALLLPSAAWVALDRVPWSWDPSWYGETCVDLWVALRFAPAHWPGAMFRAFEIKAPGIAWLGQLFVPIGQALGSIETGLLLSILGCQLVALVFVWRFVRAWIPDRQPAAVFAVLAAAAAPLFIALSHLFFAEVLQLMATSWVLWLAAAAPGMSRARISAHLLAALAVAMLAKASAPLYFLLPLVLVLIAWWRSPRWTVAGDRRPRLIAGLVAAVGLAVACTGWYVRNIRPLTAFVRGSSGGALARLYGHESALGVKVGYWLESLAGGFFHPWTAVLEAALCLVALGVAAAERRRWAPGRRRWSGLLAAACFGQVLVVLLALSLSVNEDQRYLLPLLPSVVGGLAWALSRPRNRVPLAAAMAIALLQFGVAHAQALRLKPVDRTLTSWLRPYDPDQSWRAELLGVVRLGENQSSRGGYRVIGVELPWLNANSAAFLLAQERLRHWRELRFTSLGHAPTEVAAAWRLIEVARPDFFISLEANSMRRDPDPFNLVALPVLERIAADPCFARRSFPSRHGIAIFERVCAWPAESQ